MENEHKKIKKLYGEEMLHLCKKLFPNILDQDGMLLSILVSHFFPSRVLAREIIENDMEDDFRELINSFAGLKKEKKVSFQSPYELLKTKGYTLYECKSEEDIQSFIKYYRDDERLCTFNGGRLDNCYVFFAVKDSVNEIKRETFTNPRRQDEYGTSVISIQFSKGKTNYVSIKNRYNTTIRNPDATFSCNLDNIVEGLTDSFEKAYGYHIYSNDKNASINFLTYELKYIKGSDNRFYRFNTIINDIYYCDSNIIIDNGNIVDTYYKNPERYILMDYFILDLKEKRFFCYDKYIKDGFINSINNIGKIKKISVIKENNNRRIIIDYENDCCINIVINANNTIIEYENNYIKEIDDNFFKESDGLKKITLNNVRRIGKCFLESNMCLENITLNNVCEIGDLFLFNNRNLKKINFSNLEILGNNALGCNKNINEIYLPNIKKYGVGYSNIYKLLQINYKSENNIVSIKRG